MPPGHAGQHPAPPAGTETDMKHKNTLNYETQGNPGKPDSLRLKRASAYRYAANGELPVKRLGGRVFIITAEIRPLIDGAEGNAA